MRYSMVVSIYHDGYLAKECCKALEEVFQSYLGQQDISDEFELIFVNDGSLDNSFELLLEVQKEFSFIKLIDLSRNFGQHSALACGFRAARGEYVMRMNVDCQDHPRELPRMLDEAKTGCYDLVVGQYADRQSPWFDKLTANLYFEFFKFLTGMVPLQRTSPMRVMNRAFITAYNGLTEKVRFPQGLDLWLGFRQKYIEIEHHKRADGRSSYNFLSRLKLAVTGILYFTDRPLKIIGSSGLFLSVIGLVMGLIVIAQWLAGIEFLPGYASVASVILIGFGIQIGSIGLLGLYVGRIFTEVQNRPLYIVREIISRNSNEIGVVHVD